MKGVRKSFEIVEGLEKFICEFGPMKANHHPDALEPVYYFTFYTDVHQPRDVADDAIVAVLFVLLNVASLSRCPVNIADMNKDYYRQNGGLNRSIGTSLPDFLRP